MGRADLRIMAVTKGFGSDAIILARELGLSDIGESYAQEVLRKAETIAMGGKLHFIGRIQRNKISKIADIVDLWHSVARPEVLVEIGRRTVGASVLIQVRVGDDPSKAGVDPGDIDAMLEVAAQSGVDVGGLMTMGVLGDPAATRDTFGSTRSLADRYGLTEVSMGMSGDYEDAAAAGATILRLGSALFGPRPV